MVVSLVEKCDMRSSQVLSTVDRICDHTSSSLKFWQTLARYLYQILAYLIFIIKMLAKRNRIVPVINYNIFWNGDYIYGKLRVFILNISANTSVLQNYSFIQNVEAKYTKYSSNKLVFHSICCFIASRINNSTETLWDLFKQRMEAILNSIV